MSTERSRRWPQIDAKPSQAFVVFGVALLVEQAEQVLLSGLAEGESVEGALALQLCGSGLVLAEWERRDPALDFGAARIRPPRPQVVHSGLAGCGSGVEGHDPRVGRAGAQRIGAMGCGDVLADGVSLEAVDPALALLEVDGVCRQVPVDDGVTPPVEGRLPLGRWTWTPEPSARTAS